MDHRDGSNEHLLSSFTRLRRGLIGNYAALVLLAAGTVGALSLYGGYRAVGDVAEQTIHQVIERTEANLESIFEPAERTVETLADWGTVGRLEIETRDDIEAFNDRVRPTLHRNDQLSAVGVADSTGRMYVYWQDGDTWMARHARPADDAEYGGQALRIRWNDRGEVLDEWREEEADNPGRRPWYDGAMSIDSDQTYWSDPFMFFTDDQPGLTASRQFDVPDGDESHVVALGVLLADVSAHTTSMEPTDGGYSAVMTAGGALVGLPARTRYDTPELVREDVLSTWEDLELTALGRAWEHWREHPTQDEVITADGEADGRYWAGFRNFELGDQTFVVATVIPRSDVMAGVDRLRNIAVFLIVLALGAALVLGHRSARRYRSRVEHIYDGARQLGQYRIQEQLGVGGMGDVYRAEHAMLERPTAVKLLKPERYDEESIRRFEREVKLTCRLSHPNTVTIFDYGKTDEGIFYYAMELLEGVTLRDLSEYVGPLEEGRVIAVMEQVCGALVEAHNSGLIHRDVKPTNVIVSPTDGWPDRVTVLDFGLVKDIKAPDDAQLTNQEYIQGSPGFMAPEVVRGEPSDSPAVDIFAVGAVAFTLLCQRAPFEGDSALEVLMAQIQEDPVAPSEVLDRDVDPDLETLILECMAKNPAQRPQSMTEVRRRLLACASADDWSVRRASRWWDEHAEEIIPVPGPTDGVEHPQAFEKTVEMVDTDQLTTTRDDAPEDLV